MSLQWDEAETSFGVAADEEADGDAGQRGARVVYFKPVLIPGEVYSQSVCMDWQGPYQLSSIG